MGGNKKTIGLKRPTVYHSSIPAHIRSLAQNITGNKNVNSEPRLDQSVGFIAESPKTPKKSPGVKKSVGKPVPDGDKKSSPARHPQSPTSPVTRRPTSLQTNVSSGYESEYQSSDVGSTWGWTAAEVIWKWQNNNLKTKKVYTDWANHYLDKAKCKKHIQDLQVDVTDGVILADVIEAVTNQKIADINRKPKTSMQMAQKWLTIPWLICSVFNVVCHFTSLVMLSMTHFSSADKWVTVFTVFCSVTILYFILVVMVANYLWFLQSKEEFSYQGNQEDWENIYRSPPLFESCYKNQV